MVLLKSRVIKKITKELANREKREFIDWKYSSKKKKLKVMQKPDNYFIFIDLPITEEN
jgi:hypothetical protein